MAERPILFSDEMVRAILDGRKTQTRRVVQIGEAGTIFSDPACYGHLDGKGWCFGEAEYPEEGTIGFRCPYGVPGDRLYVRECFYADSDHAPDDYPWIYYRADGAAHQHDGRSISPRAGFVPDRAGPWKPSIHMPRWASRLLLRVTDVRVERVQDISEEDARAEGIVDGGCLSCGMSEPCGCAHRRPDARDSFIRLWDSINAARGFGWDADPWVWVVSFKVGDGAP